MEMHQIFWKISFTGSPGILAELSIPILDNLLYSSSPEVALKALKNCRLVLAQEKKSSSKKMMTKHCSVLVILENKILPENPALT